ncbi:DUF4410 domain-containing protein [Geobacter sp. DSM 9736]|uniref:DUF4410 domain-containing protein n=1 Tax=Geobacter sp. DSM 9736 TaxID=1277350 RepID=UPI000B504A03|nr:DUF4410 domain-containing protein [Geobacter sp. DSM 9736]SNB44631.1 protein of unknown function [Geobacter sp. DSM 9736]
MLLKIAKIAVLLVLLAFVSACTSSGTFTVKQQLVEPINNQKSVSIVVKSDKVPEGEKEDAATACRSLKEKLYSRLVSEGLFNSTVFHPNKGDYSLEIDVTGVRLVSSTARIMLGIMAGASGIEANVLLKDSTSKVLTDFKADGSSANHPLSSESGFDYAVNQLADQIVQALNKK